MAGGRSGSLQTPTIIVFFSKAFILLPPSIYTTKGVDITSKSAYACVKL